MIKDLPITHVTTWDNFIKIRKDGYLKPQYCKFFKEDLLYFNYGRLAFKPSNKDYNWNNNEPVVMFFYPDILLSEFRFFPFDTGSLLAGRFENININCDTLNKYFNRLNYTSNSPLKFVDNTYGTLENYIEMKIPRKTNYNSWVSEILQEVDNLANSDILCDYRLTSIECQSFKAISLENCFLLAVPEHKRLELKKLNIETPNRQLFYYKDKSIEGFLPSDLSSFAQSVFRYYGQF